MKKHLLLLLVIMLLLCGCATNGGDGKNIPPNTEPIQYYEPNSVVEQESNGAILQYNLPDTRYHWVEMLGDCLLLASGDDVTRLCLVNPDGGVQQAEVLLSAGALNAHRVFSDGFAYYDLDKHSAVFMDSSLQQIRSVVLPAELTDPLISPNGKEIFFSLGNEIRAYNFETKLTRLVKSQSAAKQTLKDIVFEGQILVCEIQDSSGNISVQYVSAQNGQTLTVNSNILSLDSYKDTYFLLRKEGANLQSLVGTKDGRAYEVAYDGDPFFSALELGGVVECEYAENAVNLNYCDIASGRRTAAVAYHGFAAPKIVLPDATNQCIWLLTENASGAPYLLRWNIEKSPVEDETLYIGTLYTAQAPDEKALDRIRERIEDLNSKHGVRIRIWEDAVSVPEGHKLAVEYQPNVINGILDELEAVLNEFPKKFVYKSISSRLRICIVRSVDGHQQALQYWSDKYAFIALTPESDIRSEFIKAFAFVVDSHVLGNSPIYDYWDDLNPEGFSYGSVPDAALTAGENRVFVDTDSMISGTYDRSRIFWAAMQPNNADVFASETMQNKLTMVCEAIRDAWRLEKSAEVYPWEQYLIQPIQTKKK